MNIGSLRKCVDELKAEKPRLDYVVGILETLIEMSASGAMINKIVVGTGNSHTEIRADEPADPLIEAYAKGPIGKIT